MSRFSRLFELTVWTGSLILLYFTNPHAHHFTICPLALLGIDWCPGCGLGRAVSCILHGEWAKSFSYHWLGFPATVILLLRIYELLKKSLVSFPEKPIS